MSITRVRAGAASGTTTDPSVTLSAAPAQGNLVVAYVSSTAAANLSTLTPKAGWTGLTGVDNTDAGRLFWKVAGASEGAAQSPATIDTTTWTCTVAEYSFGGSTPEIDVSNQGGDGDTAKASPSVTPSDAGERLLVGSAFSDGNRTWSSQDFTGSPSVTVEGSPSRGPSNNGESSTLWDAILASNSGSYTASVTCSAADGGGAHIAVFMASGPSTQTLEPPAITHSSTLRAPTVAPGAVTLEPTAITHSSTLRAPSVKQTLAPTRFSHTSTLNAPTITPGDVTLVPTAITHSSTLRAPTVSGDAVVLEPPSITHSSTLRAPTLSLRLVPTAISHTSTLNAPTVSPGPVDLAPPAITHSSTLNPPTLSQPAAQTLEPASITHSSTLNAPTLSLCLAPTAIVHTSGLGTPTLTPGAVSLDVPTIVHTSVLGALVVYPASEIGFLGATASLVDLSAEASLTELAALATLVVPSEVTAFASLRLLLASAHLTPPTASSATLTRVEAAASL